MISKDNLLEKLREQEELVWINPKKVNEAYDWGDVEISMDDVLDAEARLERFAPLLMEYFDDTKETGGIIESPLKKIKNMENKIAEQFPFSGNLFLKMDSHLAVAGSIKARGGIYEVLSHAEKLAIDEGLITESDDYRKLANDECRKFFSTKTIQVGSTGNLGLSIGISSATLGFNVKVHMSSDAKQWKKDLLRSKGATVVEYDGDFTEAVNQGRKESDNDPNSYFVDDENSKTLFLGYAVAALRLKKQFEQQGIIVDNTNPLFVYIPCGVGGSPGGVSFGLKLLYGDNAHIFFIEPTNCPSMLLGMATGKHEEISVQDIGLTGKTEADGLAVGRPSGFVGKIMEPLLSGIFTIEDKDLFNYMRDLDNSESIRIEPSACAAFEGPAKIFSYKESLEYLESENLMDNKSNITHISWATGGSLVPNDVMENNLKTYL